MNKLSLLLLGAFISSGSFVASSQHPTTKFDQFGDICCDDEKARLGNFANQLLNEPDAIGYIVFYGGRQHHYPFCSSKRMRLPRHGEAQARASRLKPYILNAWPGFDAKRIVVINGGYRDSWEAELWIAPKGQPPPIAMPSVKRPGIRFRRGLARRRDYRCYV